MSSLYAGGAEINRSVAGLDREYGCAPTFDISTSPNALIDFADGNRRSALCRVAEIMRQEELNK